MSIGETHPLGGQTIEIGRGDFSFRVVAREVAVARSSAYRIKILGRAGSAAFREKETKLSQVSVAKAIVRIMGQAVRVEGIELDEFPLV